MEKLKKKCQVCGKTPAYRSQLLKKVLCEDHYIKNLSKYFSGVIILIIITLMLLL
jgi:hypothetical protein